VSGWCEALDSICHAPPLQIICAAGLGGLFLLHTRIFLASAAVACGLFPWCAAAQVAPAPVGQSAVDAGSATARGPEACADCLTIPALTPVKVEVLATLGSKTSKTGDTFPIRLAEPIVIDGMDAIPAGTTGMGEVVHAKKSGGSGAAGELVLAARYLDVGGERLRLRSMHLSPNGRSNIDTVQALNVASAAAMPALSLIGFFITGGQATVPKGTIADAKTAAAFTLASPVTVIADAQVPATQPVPPEKGIEE
jgi:hypothetical protein